MILNQISDLISINVEDLKILARLYESSYDIYEKDPNKNTTLRKVTIDHLPEENIWEFKSEIEDIECLRNQNSTVERIILYLNKNTLYAYMVEMKSSLSKGNINDFKKKFHCSLVTLSFYLTNNSFFKGLNEVELFPIGVVMFNDNHYQYTFDSVKTKHHSSLHEFIFNFKNSKLNNFQQTSVQLKSPVLNRIEIPVMFFQNPDWIPYPPTQSEEFLVDFNTLFDNTPKPIKKV